MLSNLHNPKQHLHGEPLKAAWIREQEEFVQQAQARLDKEIADIAFYRSLGVDIPEGKAELQLKPYRATLRRDARELKRYHALSPSDFTPFSVRSAS